MKLKIFLLLIILIPLLFSCKESPCDLKTSSLLQIGFYTLKDKKVIPAIDSVVNIYGVGEEGKSLYTNENIATAVFPLSQNQDMCSFIINSNDTIDTLTFHYTRQLKMISKECGFATIFNINSVNFSKNKFDSISIIDPVVNTSYEENIRIFF